MSQIILDKDEDNKKIQLYRKEYYQKNKIALDKKCQEWKEANRDRYNAYCREYYKRNTDKKRAYDIKRKDKIRKYLATRRQKAIAIIADHFGKVECIRCGYNNFTSLDGHHIDHSQKQNYRDTLSHWINTLPKLKEKLSTCRMVLLCKNCHTELHANEWSLKEMGVE